MIEKYNWGIISRTQSFPLAKCHLQGHLFGARFHDHIMHQQFDMLIGEWLVETTMNENIINATSYAIININVNRSLETS